MAGWFFVLQNSRGQSLIEYLMLVCLVAVGTTAVVKVVGQNVAAQFNNISKSLRDDKSGPTQLDSAKPRDVQQKDFSNFLER